MTEQPVWFKSSHSDDEGDNCVEVALPTPQLTVHIRDSKNATGPELALPAPAWTAFLSGVSAVQPGA
ncbi:DUF397 domain-containing protein [Streptomyces prunicolor]|uniref:DUF397 domain-containing protein n=1 Tax=Streptomyces prunicolor TaxID=67348 RepID=A0ABU4FD12_9ACTN|nr:DUF397 domain-containing protein [Streptomyces prunicolor]MDV7218484.1 DUF397 domain-containing protein [Streptomyces prunicolor]